MLKAFCICCCSFRSCWFLVKTVKEKRQWQRLNAIDLLRKKVNEFLLGQKASLLSKKLEYANWKSGHLANLTKYQKVITEAEKEEKLSVGQIFGRHGS